MVQQQKKSIKQYDLTNKNPPENMSGADLWSQITARPRPHKIIPLPIFLDENGNSQGNVAVVVLTQTEVMAANAAAHEATVRHFKTLNTVVPRKGEATESFDTFLNEQLTLEMLFRAYKDPNDLNKSFFTDKSHIGKHLLQDECAVLLNYYLGIRSEMSPVVTIMSEEEVELWIEILTEGGEATGPLGSLSLGSLKTLLLYMANQLSTLRKEKSSPGVVPENITKNT